MFKSRHFRIPKVNAPSDASSERIFDRQMKQVCEYNERNDIAWTFPLNQ